MTRQDTDSEQLMSLLYRNYIHYGISGDESVKISKEALGHDTEEIEPDVLNDFRDDSTNEMFSARNKNCWMSLNAKQHFQVMDHLDGILVSYYVYISISKC